MGAMNRVVTGILAGVVLAGGGCGSVGQAPMGSACMPPPFAVSPAGAAPGDSIRVSAKDASCNPAYGGSAQVQLQVMDGSGEIVVDTLAPMNDAGGFSAVLTVPDSAVPGQGAVVAHPHNVDWCDDTGRNNRLRGTGAAGPAAGGVQRVSCVMPSQPLTIEP